MRKIILLCSAGMSTSMLVKKMQEAAKAQNYDCSIAAFPFSVHKFVSTRIKLLNSARACRLMLSI